MGKPADWVRIVMHNVTEDWVHALDPSTLDAFEISGKKWSSFPFRSYANAHFPDFDICEGPPPGSYDFIVAEQVWEHLKFPHRAARHVLQALRPGGWFLVTVPFLIRNHPTPLDCSRWSATGLHHFLVECGFEQADLLTGQWGNRDCLIANLDTWVRYEAGRHSLENDDRFPLVAWALARKPA